MATDTLTLDVAASPLDLSLGTQGFVLRSFEAPPPSRKRVEASSIDTEGALPVESQYDNRTITMVIRATPQATRTAWYAVIDKLQQKIAKINREGGQLKRIAISGTAHYFDLFDAEADVPWDNVRYALRMDQDITVKFLASPFAYGDEITTLPDHTETTLPYLSFTETGIIGDVPANGRLVVDNDDASNGQWWATWAVQSRFYSAAATAGFFYEAEGLTILGGGSLTTQAGFSGSGSTAVQSGTLGVNVWSDILSTQNVGGGSWQQHLGGYRVYARVYNAASGNVNLAFAYSNGDGFTPYHINGAVPVTVKSKSVLVDLGLIYLQPIAGASLQWRGKLVGKSDTAANTIKVDYLLFVPISEGSGRAQAAVSGESIAFPSQSVQFRSDGVVRRDGTGTLWVPVKTSPADLLRVPVAGAEGRTTRIMVKMSRDTPLGDGGTANPAALGDAGIDDLSAKLYYTPRWLMVPGS